MACDQGPACAIALVQNSNTHRTPLQAEELRGYTEELRRLRDERRGLKAAAREARAQAEQLRVEKQVSGSEGVGLVRAAAEQ